MLRLDKGNEICMIRNGSYNLTCFGFQLVWADSMATRCSGKTCKGTVQGRGDQRHSRTGQWHAWSIFCKCWKNCPLINLITSFSSSCEFHKLFLYFFSVSISPTNEGGKLVTYFNMAPGGVPVFLSHSKHRVEPHSLHSSCFIL